MVYVVCFWSSFGLDLHLLFTALVFSCGETLQHSDQKLSVKRDGGNGFHPAVVMWKNVLHLDDVIMNAVTQWHVPL